MKHVMLDLESLGNNCICQIGACYFDIETGEIGDVFKINIDFNTITGNPNPSTIKWWFEQKQEVRDSVVCEEYIMSETDALHKLNDILSAKKNIWSHTYYDFVMVMNKMNELGIKPKFSWKHERDIRTLVALAKYKVKRDLEEAEGVRHDALVDCINQVKYCSGAYRKLKKID